MVLTATAMLDDMDRISCHLWDNIERQRMRGDSGAVVVHDGQERPTNERRERVQRS